MPKKVLIITYYWPPAGGIGVVRWVKFAKYLREHGWEPIIYTTSNGSYPLKDTSMEKDVPVDLKIIKRPIWEPFQFYQFLFGKKDGQTKLDDIKWKDKASLTQKISNWIRGNFFIPDARSFWVKPSIKYLTSYLNANPVDAIVSTGPPHSIHLIALGLKKKLSLPWLADFRDPWTTMDYYQQLMLTSWANRKHLRLEAEVLNTADAVIVVGNGMKQEFEKKRHSKVMVIPNGFDEADFNNTTVELTAEFSIVYIGSFFERINPIGLWKALNELNKENHPLIKKLKIRLVGRTDQAVIQSINEFGLSGLTELISYQPHEEALRQMRTAQVLLLCVYEKTPWVLTGKLFEYFAANRPILCIGPPHGDAAQAISDAKVGQTFASIDVAGIKENLKSLYARFESGQLNVDNTTSKLFSHRNLALRVSEILNEISS